jgi:DNA repair protein RadD
VGNVVRHGLPDKARIWSLDARERRPRAANPDDDIPLRYCPECTQPYERILTRCPYCHHKPVPASRSRPEFVDGDLFELDPAVLAEMRGAVAKVDNPDATIQGMQRGRMPEAAINGFRKTAKKRLEMQEALRESMGWWTHIQAELGRSDSESYRLFYHTFGIDVLSAQALGRPEAITLANRVNDYIGAR